METRGDNKAVAFRVTNLKVSVHPGILIGDEVEITLGNGSIISTDAGRGAFFMQAKSAGESLFGKEIPDWILKTIWDIYTDIRGLDKSEQFIPVPKSVTFAA